MNSRLRQHRLLPGVDVLGIAALTLICFAFFWRMVFTDQILPRGDTFAYFYPYWDYRNEALAAGKIPLWNPYLFMGVPFLANSQAGVLYPLNWPLMWLDAPTAVKAATVAHIVLAAWGMYCLSRRLLKLRILAAVFAGAVFALGGYLTSQVEHINQLQGLAWLPWLIWLGDETLTGGHKTAPAWLALILAMQLLAGHSQTAFISGVGLLAWTVWHLIGRWRDLRKTNPEQTRGLRSIVPLGRPLVGLLAAGSGAIGLAAAQLLPTLELTRLSNRSAGLPFIEALSFSLRPTLLGRAMLPQYTQPSLFSEYVAYIGVVALILAMIGAWASRKDWRLLGLSVLSAVAFFLALGAYNPAYWALVKVVPGFGLFRAPARWLALWALASAGLAGAGLDWLGSETNHSDVRPLLIAAPGVAVLILLAFLAPLASSEVAGATRPSVAEIVAWLAAEVLSAAIIIGILRSGEKLRDTGTAALAALSLVELFLASRVEPFNRLTVPASWSSARPSISTILAADQGAVPPPRFLSLSDTRFDPGDLHEIEASYNAYLDEDQVYDYVVATKEKEILAPNLPLYWHTPAMDGFDGGILPTRDYTHLTSFFVDKDKLSPDGRLRENLRSVPDLQWLRIANVRWIITDKVFDAWLDGVYYDLQFPERLEPGAADPVEGYPAEPFDATEIGIVGHIEADQLVADGTPIGTLTVYPDGAGSTAGIVLPLSFDADQPGAIGGGSQPPQPAGNFTPDRPHIAEFRTMIGWSDAPPVARVSISLDPRFSSTLVVRGMTLIDGRTGAFSALTLSHDHTLSLANSGDVKVYAFDGALPRAYLVCDPIRARSPNEAWAQVQSIPSTGATVIEDPNPTSGACEAHNPGTAEITTYEPEQVTAIARVAEDGSYLVLSDAWYPGWEAVVDGQNVEIYRANGLFRAVRVARGEHRVVFSYRSRPFEIGALISAASIIALAAAMVIPGLRRRQAQVSTG